jgi:hypothetical protein
MPDITGPVNTGIQRKLDSFASSFAGTFAQLQHKGHPLGMPCEKGKIDPLPLGCGPLGPWQTWTHRDAHFFLIIIIIYVL